MATKTRTRWTWIDEYRLTLRSVSIDELTSLQALYDNQRVPSQVAQEKCIAVRAELSRREKGIEEQL